MIQKLKKIKDYFKRELVCENNDFKYIFLKIILVNISIIFGFFWGSIFWISIILLCSFMLFETGIKKIYYLIALLPFNNVFVVRNISLSSVAMLLFTVFIGLKFLIDLNKKKEHLNLFLTILFAMAILYCFFPFGHSYILSKKSAIALTFVILYFAFIYRDRMNLKEIFFILCLSTLMACLVALRREDIPFIQKFIYKFKINNVYRFSGLILDPNYFGLEILTILCIATCLKVRKEINILFYLIIPVFSCFGIMTCSKAFVLSWLLWLGISIILELFRNKNLTKKIILPVVLVVETLVCLMFIPSYTSALKDRMLPSKNNETEISNSDQDLAVQEGFINADQDLAVQEGFINTEDFSTGRFDIWKYYFNKISSSPKTLIFGNGVGEEYFEIDGAERAIHNTLIQLLFYYGIAGIALLLTLLGFVIYKDTKSGNKFSFKGLFLIIPIMLMMCSLDCFVGFRFFITIIVIYALVTTKKSAKKESIKKDENKKKLLIVHRNATIGGVETSLVNFIKFNKDKYDITLCLMSKTGDKLSEIKDVEVIECTDKMKFWGFEAVNKSRNTLSRFYYFGLKILRKLFSWNQFIINMIVSEQEKIEGFDCCICYYQDPFCESFVLDKVICSKKFLLCHTDAELLYEEDFIEKRVNQFSKVFCLSKTCKNNISKKYPNVANLDILGNFQDSETIKEKSLNFNVNYDNSKFNLLTVARASFEKAPLRMLSVIKKLQNDGYDISWTFVGGGPLLEDMKKYIRENDVKNITLTDAVLNPFPYYIGADLFVLGSISEGLPMVIAESMTLGLPVLSTDVGSAKEVLNDYGFICDNNEESIYEKIKEIISNKKELLKAKENLKNYKNNNDKIAKKLKEEIEE